MTQENTVQTYVAKMQEAITHWRKAESGVFVAFLEAYQNLNTEQFNEFKDQIQLSKNAIFKMEQVCKKKILRTHLDKLPSSWGTLFELTKIDDDKLAELIAEEKIPASMSRSDAIDLAKNAKVKKTNGAPEDQGRPMTFGGRLTLTLKDKNCLDDAAVQERLQTLIHDLKQFFTVEGEFLPTLEAMLKEAA